MLKVKNIFLIVVLLISGLGKVVAQDTVQLMTLFTTPDERQVINNNRYKGNKPVQPIEAPKPVDTTDVVMQMLKEDVTVSYHIAGVTSNNEGGKTAWINGESYESGDIMDDGSKIRINNTSVIITTADGKSYSGVSGELLNITYQRVVKQ